MIKEYFFCKKCERGVERIRHTSQPVNLEGELVDTSISPPSCCTKMQPMGEGKDGELNLSERLRQGQGPLFSSPPVTKLHLYV